MTNTLFISQARVKEFLNQQNLRVSYAFYAAFNDDLKNMLLRAAKRAKANRRSTVLVIDV